jgi:CheY-like chemotaxis protein
MTRKILIADDEEDIKVIVQLFLESKGFEIVTAYDGLDAVDKAKSEQPDLVLLDVMMPVIDGFEVCKRLKADPVTADIPIVMLSASSQTESKKRASAAGAVDYISKPFDPDQLQKVIEGHLN